MITIEQYFGPYADHPDGTTARIANAVLLLAACQKLEEIMRLDGVVFRDSPTTHSGVSGEGNGGFRPQDCPIGAARSSHKEGLAVDRYDPDGNIDLWCMNHQQVLAECGIYIEHPSKTLHWSHWTIKAPGSGNRVFKP